MRKLIVSVVTLISLTACQGQDDSTVDMSLAQKSALSSQSDSTDDAHADCSKYVIVGRNWRNRAFTPSQGATYIDDLEITSDCKMRRSYCNQEFSIPSTLDPNFAQYQTFQITVSNVSYDGCFTPGTITCKIIKGSAYYTDGMFRNQTKQYISLQCAGTRMPNMSYIEE